jgi:hypothetical protein
VRFNPKIFLLNSSNYFLKNAPIFMTQSQSSGATIDDTFQVPFFDTTFADIVSEFIGAIYVSIFGIIAVKLFLLVPWKRSEWFLPFFLRNPRVIF